MSQKMTHDDFINKLYKNNSHFQNDEFVVVSHYEQMRSEILCECPTHGEWKVVAHNLIKGSGCPECAKINRAKLNTKTTEKFLEELKKKNFHYKNNEFKVIGKYINSKTSIDCECPKHGIWKNSTPDHLLNRNSFCPVCTKIESQKKQAKSHEDFLNELDKKNIYYHNKEFEVIGKYINNKTPITCKCKEHGIWSTSRPSYLLKGGHCPKCSGKNKTTNDFIEELRKRNIHYKNGEFKVIGEYINAKTPIICECPIHGAWNTSIPANLLRGDLGCPKCNNTSSSFAENYIRCALQLALPDAEIPDKGDRKLLNGYEIDIPVYKYGFAVEFGAWHWHEEKWMDDYTKFKKLKAKGIKLFTIYDTYNGDVIFPEDFELKLFPNNLANEKNYVSLKKIIKSYLEPEIYKTINWDKVKENALKLSAIKSTDDFIKELYEKNSHFRSGEFEVTGGYVNSQTPIECKCPEHGVWNTSKPDALLNKNSRCPKCAGIVKKTHEEFLKELEEKNEHFKNKEFAVIGKYKGATTPITCKCPEHGEWNPVPNDLLKGVGCKKCSYEKNAKKRTFTHKEFLIKLYEKNSHYRNGEFTIIGKYINSETPIECECKIHGIWNTTVPSSLLYRNGTCPKCSGKNKTIDDFIEELRKRNAHYNNGEFKVVGKYKGAVQKIECECPIHGIWNTSTPNGLLTSNIGCPKCARKKHDKRKENKR